MNNQRASLVTEVTGLGAGRGKHQGNPGPDPPEDGLQEEQGTRPGTAPPTPLSGPSNVNCRKRQSTRAPSKPPKSLMVTEGQEDQAEEKGSHWINNWLKIQKCNTIEMSDQDSPDPCGQILETGIKAGSRMEVDFQASDTRRFLI